MALSEKTLNIGTVTASADLSAKKHYLVAVSGANTVGLATVGSQAVGSLGNKPESGIGAEVLTGIIQPVVAGEAIAAGADVAPDSTGRARTALVDDYVVGTALTAAAAAGAEFRCLMLPKPQKQDTLGAVVSYGVAATKTVTANKMVALDADGYLVDAGDATAVTFWGIALATADNSAGADGALTCAVSRAGTKALTGASLTQADVGKEVYVGADSATVTTAKGRLYVGVIDSIASATAPTVRYEATPIEWVAVGVAATKSITADRMVALDADGYLVDAGDATAVSFWGIALAAADNSAGADGAINCAVSRDCKRVMTGSGLAATDLGKEVWVGADSATVTTTPGNILVGTIESIGSATTPVVVFKPLPIVGQRTDRQFTIPFTWVGAVGAVGVVAFEDNEFARKYKVLSGFADAQTAPGGAYVCTIELDDGTTQFAVTITGAATHGENKTAGATPFLAATDTDVTLVDDDASGATADVKGQFLCEAL